MLRLATAVAVAGLVAGLAGGGWTADPRWWALVGPAAAATLALALQWERTSALFARRLATEVRRHDATRRELHEAQAALVESSRLAGRAVVADGVLQEVLGAIDNAGVTARLLQDIGRSGDNIATLDEWLHEHFDELPEVMAGPKRGGIPDYVRRLGEVVEREEESREALLESLEATLGHVRAVVHAQRKHVGAVYEPVAVSLDEVVEEVAVLTRAMLASAGVDLELEYEEDVVVELDRQSVLDILAQLLSNAVHAVRDVHGPRRIVLGAERIDAQVVQFVVRDNGCGIAADDLERIFRPGVTLRSDGNGFGLHAAAHRVEALGGQITAHSEGSNRGASFVVEVPVPAVAALTA